MSQTQSDADTADEVNNPFLKASADIRLAIGTVRDEVEKLRRDRVRPEGKPLRRILNGTITIPASGLTDGFVDLGVPSQGWWWTVRSVYIGPATGAAGIPAMRQTTSTATVYSLHATGLGSTTQIAASGDAPQGPGNVIWAKGPNITASSAVWDDPSADTVAVIPQDHLIAAAWGAAANSVFMVTVVVEMFQDSRSRQVVEV